MSLVSLLVIYKRDYSDCDEQGDKSDPEPYDYTDESDCYIDDGEDHGHHTNGSGISWHNSINIDQHSNSTVCHYRKYAD